MRVFFLSLLATALGFCLNMSAQEAPLKETTPDWVIEQPVPPMPEARRNAIRNGIGYLLTDNQSRWNGEGYDYYYRVVYEVTDRSGLEDAALLNPSYDPEDTTMSFNRLTIKRDGQYIERLTETEIDLIQQENEMQYGILDGALTAVIQLEDVRVGDIIDYAYHGHVTTPLWPGEFFTAQSVEWAVPVASQTYRLLAPADQPLHMKKMGTDIPVTVRQIGNQTEYAFNVSDADPLSEEQNIAYGSVPYGYVSFSSMEDWSELVDWGFTLYEVDHELPKDFAQKIDALARQHPSKENQIVQALRLVQNDIRYLGLQAGLGSHKPRPPSETLANGYGDCKDKALLLSVILQTLGMDARPALANTQDGFTIKDGAVVVGAFNHVIVHVRLDGQDIWLDPTLSHQGGSLKNLNIPDYGYVLPIRSDTTSLVLIEKPFPTLPLTEIEETISLSGEDDTFDRARLDVKTVHRGQSADGFRNRIANNGAETTGRQYLDYYSEIYPGIKELAPLSVSDDLDSNEVHVTESYTISPQAYESAKLGEEFPVRATAVIGRLPTNVEANRRMDLWLPYGTHNKHTIRVHFPGKVLSVPEGELLSAHGVTVQQSYESSSEWLTIGYTLKVKERSAKADVAQDIIKLKKDLDDIAYLNLYLDRASPTFAKRIGLDAPLSAETETALTDAFKLLREQEYADSLEILSNLLEENPEPTQLRGFIQLSRASVFEAQNRRRAAIPAYKEAFALITPTWTSSYFSYAGMLRQNDPVGAAAIMERLFDEHPAEIGNVNNDWLSRLLRELSRKEAFEARDGLMVSAAKAQYAQRNDIDVMRWIYAAAIEPLITAGDVETAQKLVLEVIDPEMLALILTKRSTEPVWDVVEEEYAADLSIALERFIEDSKQHAQEEENDFEIQARYMNALRQAGLYKDAAEYGEAVTSNWARIEAVGEEAYWFVNEYAYALADVGRTEDAVRMMDRVLEFGLEENPSLISMAINRSHIMLHAGRFEQALEASTALEQLENDYTSDIGKTFILSAKTCALNELGETDEACSVYQDDFLPLAEENPSAHMQVLLCFADQDAAADLLIDRLEDEKTRDSALYGFIAASRSGEMPAYKKTLRDRLQAVQSTGKVQSAFSPLARGIEISGHPSYWGHL